MMTELDRKIRAAVVAARSNPGPRPTRRVREETICQIKAEQKARRWAASRRDR